MCGQDSPASDPYLQMFVQRTDVSQIKGNTGQGLCSSNQMPEPLVPHTKMSSIEAGRELADLMERQLGVNFEGYDSLRLFIKAYWNRVSTLAHIIHEGE